MKRKFSTKDLSMIGLFVAIIAIVSQIVIPMPYGVPMTLQTFIVPLAGVILGSKRGALAAGIYSILGAIGVPVFSQFMGGLGIVFGPTGGFIIAFPIMAFFAGLGMEKGGKRWLIGGLALAIIVEYIFGIAMFMIVTGSSVGVALVACVLPFIPTEIIKAVLVGTVGVRCRNALIKGGIISV